MHSLFLALVTAALPALACAQATPPSPVVRAFGDNADWITVEKMTYVVGSTSTKIVVPKGFVTDFASIPRALWSFGLSPHGQYSRAAVIHDYLYWSQLCTRDQSDRLLVIAMKESAVGRFDEAAIFQGVHRFGGSAWASNARERRANLPRVIPEEFILPADPNVNWKTYRKWLVDKGVRDPSFDSDSGYCVLADSTKVP